MLFRSGLVLISAFSLLLPCWSVIADDIRVVTEYRSHYQQQNADGSLGGYMTDIIRALFDITGDKPQFEVHPWGRAYTEAVNNPNVMIYSMSFNPTRAALFDCVAELDTEQLYFWALKSRVPLALNSITELHSYRIGVTHSSNPDQYLTAQGLPKLLRVATPEQAVGMLFRDRLDLVIGTEASITDHVLTLGFAKEKLKKVFELEALNHPLCAAFNRESDSDVRARYRAAFVTLQKNGTLAQIRQRWQFVTQ